MTLFRALRRAVLFLLFISCASWATQPVRGELVGLDTVDYVIQISIDGLRADTLRNLVAASPATYPNFRRLELEGAFTYNARSDLTHTETIPNHVSMVTGRPVSQHAGQPNNVHHGFTANFPGANDTIHANGNPNVPYKSSTFDVVHDNGLLTALYASKMRLQLLDRSFNATNGALDTIGYDNGRDKIDVSQFTDNSSASIVTAFVTNQTATPRDYTFIHITEPDGAGHASGFTSAAYITAIGTTDARLGQIFAMIDVNPLFTGHTAIVLAADHGGGAPSNNHTAADEPVNYTIPFFVWGAGLPAGGNLYELLSNRFDPSFERPTYADPLQPLWSGDAGNIALQALGRGPIPGSSLVPVFVPEPAGWFLMLAGAFCVVTSKVAWKQGVVRQKKRIAAIFARRPVPCGLAVEKTREGV